jgi:hypothetical protein
MGILVKRSRIVGGIVAASMMLGLPMGATATATPSSSGPVAQIACKRATIGGQSRCIARGQYCAKRYERDYRKYGYSCSKKDSRGRWHLQ